MGEMPLSASRRNLVIKAGSKPLRWAFGKDMIESDFTRGIMLFPAKPLNALSSPPRRYPGEFCLLERA
jgi:hypothetical protein